MPCKGRLGYHGYLDEAKDTCTLFRRYHSQTQMRPILSAPNPEAMYTLLCWPDRQTQMHQILSVPKGNKPRMLPIVPTEAPKIYLILSPPQRQAYVFLVLRPPAFSSVGSGPATATLIAPAEARAHNYLILSDPALRIPISTKASQTARGSFS